MLEQSWNNSRLLPLELPGHQSTSAALVEYEYDIFTQITRHSTIGQTKAPGATRSYRTKSQSGRGPPSDHPHHPIRSVGNQVSKSNLNSFSATDQRLLASVLWQLFSPFVVAIFWVCLPPHYFAFFKRMKNDAPESRRTMDQKSLGHSSWHPSARGVVGRRPRLLCKLMLERRRPRGVWATKC